MTNETYLHISYFAAISTGAVFTLIISAILCKPLREATTSSAIKKQGSLIMRIFPSWLILAVLLAFISVSYFDCSHTTYKDVIKDRAHLVNITHEQIHTILFSLAVALFAFCLLLVVYLWATARNIRQK